ncbi:MAG: Cof-type HAD-IIB family hydrolase [Chitinivibrionales bacterium]|nr:Cof-type HAD-IIB family hydrolase [Chitinivibrionales bacterium]
MPPKLLAFDLDGTLLTTDKRLTAANRDALEDMVRTGAVVALASGRLRSSMMKVASQLAITPAMLTLNGAAVYTSTDLDAEPVHTVDLPLAYARELLDYAHGQPFALNFYRDDSLYSVRNAATGPWVDLYVNQTSSEYTFVDSLAELHGTQPEKIIFVGEPSVLDEQEKHFRARWDTEIYIVRTWDYYLEFLHRDANKGTGIKALANAFGIALADVAAFGDSHNDIPMLQVAGHGIAMANATAEAKAAAGLVSPWTNDQDAIAREWERLCKD